MRPLLPFLLFVLGASGPAMAEKADASKPTNIVCDECQFDGVSGRAKMAGNIVITRGTLRIEADRGEAGRAPDGFQSATVEAVPGNKVRFRQKGDGPGEQWTEGEAMRVEYDERSGIVKLIDAAMVRRLANGKLSDETMGDRISYNMRTEMFDILPAGKGGRGTIILQPRRAPPPGPAVAGTANVGHDASTINGGAR